MANIPACKVEKLLSCVFLLLRWLVSSFFFFLPLKNNSPWSFILVRSNHNKTEKRPEKIIPWRRYHLRHDVAVRKAKSPCLQAKEVANTIVALIFHRAAMEKTNSPCPLAVAVEEDEEINPQNQETWHGETLTDSVY
jgi:hypothetical protein